MDPEKTFFPASVTSVLSVLKIYFPGTTPVGEVCRTMT
jgi:hypothetical protein